MFLDWLNHSIQTKTDVWVKSIAEIHFWNVTQGCLLLGSQFPAYFAVLVLKETNIWIKQPSKPTLPGHQMNVISVYLSWKFDKTTGDLQIVLMVSKWYWHKIWYPRKSLLAAFPYWLIA
jgi:hypothetical protein